MQRKSFTEPGPYAQNGRVSGGAQVFGPLSIVLLQCVTIPEHFQCLNLAQMSHAHQERRCKTRTATTTRAGFKWLAGYVD